MNTNDVNLRIRLKHWRLKRALTVDELSEKSKVSTSTIANIEKRGHIARPSVIRRLATALEISVDDLIVETKEKVA